MVQSAQVSKASGTERADEGFLGEAVGQVWKIWPGKVVILEEQTLATTNSGNRVRQGGKFPIRAAPDL